MHMPASPLLAISSPKSGSYPGHWMRCQSDGNVLPRAEKTCASAICCARRVWYVASSFPDTRPALDILRAMGLKIGLISNTMWPGEFHRRELERFDLLPYFDCVVFSSDVGLWKPRPEVYHLALDALGVAANDALFVGDIPEHDIVGAQRAGIRAVYRRNESFSLDAIRPDATVSLLTELSELIKGWE